METTTHKNTATLIHLSALSQYIIPFGGYILPIAIWSATKDKSEFVNAQGKQTVNFQLSLFVYSLVLAIIAIPVFCVSVLNNIPFEAFISDGDFVFKNLNLQNISGMIAVVIMAVVLFGMMKVAEFFLIIYAAVKASNGEDFRYPLTIPFLK